METWAGINAPAGRKKDQGIGMHPMQAVCRCVCVCMTVCVRACLHEGVKPGAQHE